MPHDEYMREKSVYDGELQNFAWHTECGKDAEEGWANGDDSEFMPYSAPRPMNKSPLPDAQSLPDPCPQCERGGTCNTVGCGRKTSSELMALYGTPKNKSRAHDAQSS